MIRSRVLLPQPEGPSRLTKAPLSIAKSMPSSATTPLRKLLPTPERVMSGSVINDFVGPLPQAVARLLLHSDLLVDEFQRVRLLPIHIGRVDSPLRPFFEEL